MATVSNWFGDVPVELEYEISGEDVDLQAVNVGEIDISSGLSRAQLDNYEAVCYWHNNNSFVDESANYADHLISMRRAA